MFKCGSHDVTRSSSVVEDPKKDDTTSNSEVPSTNDVIGSLYRQKMYNNK